MSEQPGLIHGTDAALAAVSAPRMLAVVRTLAGDRFAGRRVGSAGGRAAREWLAGQVAERLAGSGPRIEIEEFGLPGTGDLAANLYVDFRRPSPLGTRVLLTAHYDGVGDRDGVRYPGASDNATGVAVVLEAAELLTRMVPESCGLTLSVALLDAEELGALGSVRHAAALTGIAAAAEADPNAALPFVLNVDGAGRLDTAVAVEGGGPAALLLAALDQAGRHVGVPLVAGQVASDNRRYASAGLPTVGLGAGMPGYHSPDDTPDQVRPDTLTAMARLVIATVSALAGPIGSTTHDDTPRLKTERLKERTTQ